MRPTSLYPFHRFLFFQSSNKNIVFIERKEWEEEEEEEEKNYEKRES